MFSQVGCFSRARSVVIWFSFVSAVGGWGFALLLWASIGTAAAGVHPGFLLALTVGCTFTVTLCASVVMPDNQRIYGIGHRDGWAAAVQRYAPPPDASRPLSLVQH